MGHEYKLTRNLKDSNDHVELAGVMEDNVWEILEAFIQYAEELINTKWVQNGTPAALRVSWEQGSPIKVGINLPPWDDVIVFLYRLRPIVLQNESTNFYRVNNILAKALDHPYINSFLAEQRRIYKGQRMQEMIKISSDEVLLNSENMLLDWLNAYEYHRDKNKKESIDKLHQMFPLEASKAVFLHLLSDKAQAIYNLTGFVRVLIGKQRDITLQAKLK